MNFRAAVFDLDGTLLDSVDVWESIDIAFLKKRGLPVPSGYVTNYEYAHNVALSPFTGDYLRQLKYAGIKLAVATGLQHKLTKRRKTWRQLQL